MSPNPQKTADFYINMFGAKTDRVVKRPSGEVTIFLNLNGTTIVISEKSQPPFGQDHFGIATDNIEATVKDLKTAGYKFTMEITAINPKTKIAYFQGPENTLIELVEE
jgi:predicted enzyme related to lactoylglutathione lyase